MMYYDHDTNNVIRAQYIWLCGTSLLDRTNSTQQTTDADGR